jgi:hypothetical protein
MIAALLWLYSGCIKEGYEGGGSCKGVTGAVHVCLRVCVCVSTTVCLVRCVYTDVCILTCVW